MFARNVFGRLVIVAVTILGVNSVLAGQTEPGLPTPPAETSAGHGGGSESPVSPGLPSQDTTPAPVKHNSPPPMGEPLPEGSGPEKSVVQILTVFQEPLWDSPWQFTQANFASGSGFLIDGNRVMTNAHVVAWHTRLLVKKYHDPKPYAATVEFVGHDVDLAVLRVTDPEFSKDMKPLDFGGLPKVRSNVTTYGFPAGGQQISYTRGVVSRIEVERYVHINNRSFLACQTDAAINPGNSGGPVIQDDKVVGVAFEAISGLENTSYFIPTPIIKHFLTDIQDGKYDGVPEAGIHFATLTNPAYRAFLKLPPDSKRGIRVDSVSDIPDTRSLIKPDDVILQVGDFPVDEDGTVTYEDNTVGASVAFDMAQDGDILPLKVWRDGKEMDVNLPVHVYAKDRILGSQYDVEPPYYIYGGLVFTGLSLDYLRSLGDSLASLSGRTMIYELRQRRLADPENYRSQPVILTTILNSPCNANMAIRGRAVVDKINGIKINSLADVPKALDATKQYIVIEYLPNDQFEVLDRSAAILETPKILQTYNIPAQGNINP